MDQPDAFVVNDRRTYAIIGAAMKVHRTLGPGFLEAAYAEALAIEMAVRGIPYEREVRRPIVYDGRLLQTVYRADFVCHGDIIVELKAQTALTRIDVAQVVNYLKAAGHELGLLLNFGTSSLERERVIFKAGWTPEKSSASI